MSTFAGIEIGKRSAGAESTLIQEDQRFRKVDFRNTAAVFKGGFSNGLNIVGKHDLGQRHATVKGLFQGNDLVGMKHNVG